MVEAASTFKNVSDYLAGKAGEAAGAAEQYAAAAEKYAAAGDKASAAQSKAAAEQYAAQAEELMIKSKTLEAVAAQVSDKELDVEQTGYGITPIAALAINYKRLSFGLRFEYNTSIEMASSLTINPIRRFAASCFSSSSGSSPSWGGFFKVIRHRVNWEMCWIIFRASPVLGSKP